MNHTPLGLRSGTDRHWHPCNHPSCQALAEQQLDMLREDVEPWLAARNDDAEVENEELARTLVQAAAKNDELVRSLTELKKIDLIGPLTAEEWMEFRLRDNDEEDAEMLHCCANTSAIRDDIFHLMRSYAEDALLGRIPMERIMDGVNGHHDLVEGDHPAAVRLLHLLTRMCAYYGVPVDYVRPEGDR